MADADDYGKRLREVAETARSLGMRVSVLRVGDVVLQLAEPWGPTAAPTAKTEPETSLQPEDVLLSKLRDAAKRNGVVASDDMLRAMAPALMRS